jgi:MFS family permease
MSKQRYSDVSKFFALEHNITVLLGALLVIGMGEELWVRFMPKYLEVLGASAVAIGAFGSFKRVVDTIYQYPGGWLADRLGRNRALVMFNLIAALGYLLYLLTVRWELIIIGTLLVLAWSSMSQPAIFALIGDTLGRSRRAMGFSVQSIWKRIPIVIAPPLGGYLLARFGFVSGMRIGFAISMVLALAAIFLQTRFYRPRPVNADEQKANIKAIWRMMPAALRHLLLADCLVRFGSNVAALYVVLLVVNVRGKSPLEFGVLTSLQMITAILVYLPAARLADRFSRQPFVLATFAFFALFPLTLVILPPAWLFAAFVIAGLREIGEPARKARIVDLAEDAHRGRVVGLYYLIRGLATSPAALLGGIL